MSKTGSKGKYKKHKLVSVKLVIKIITAVAGFLSGLATLISAIGLLLQ